MEAGKVKASSGYRWYGCAWRLFTRAWGVWLVMTLIMVGISVVLSLVPLVGSLAANLLVPVFSGGFLLAARAGARGQAVDTGMLFRPFQESGLLQPLLLLGLLELVAQLALGVVIMLTVGTQVMNGAMMTGEVDLQQVLTPGILLGSLLVLLLAVLVIMAFVYAVPLVALDGVALVEALKLSYRACWRNMGALAIFGLIYLVLGVLAILPMGLGLILLVPVSLLALYCSYDDIFR